jgi:hypothetical protein
MQLRNGIIRIGILFFRPGLPDGFLPDLNTARGYSEG